MALTQIVPVDPAGAQLGETGGGSNDGAQSLALAVATPVAEDGAGDTDDGIETLALAVASTVQEDSAAGAIQPYEPGVLVIAAPGQEGSARASLGAIKPYCGASHTLAVRAEDTRVGALELHGYPIPAWSDVGIASHLRGLGDLADGSQGKKNKMPEVLRPAFDLRLFIFRVLLVVISLAENICCWLTYLEIRNADRRFYNKFEAYALGLPDLDTALAIVAVLNTFYLFAFWVAVGVLRMDNHRALAIGRLLLSVAMAVICFMAVFFAEGTKVSPFACTLTSMLHLQVLFLGGLLSHRGEEPSKRRKCLCRIGLAFFALLSLAWLLLFLLDGMAFLREDACRATKNRAMPVRLQGVTHWQCATWGEKHYIERLPASGAEIVQAWCDTSFHELDQAGDVNNNVLWSPSQGAHYVQCPPNCQSHGLGLEVVGCQVYDARSPICSAAVQVGLVGAEVGGLVKVVGRAPPVEYDMCHLRGVLSVEDVGRLPGAAVLATRAARNASTLPGAFYFQEVEGLQEYDVVTLHAFRRTSSPGPKRPYESYVADVSWRVGGGELHREEITLGPPAENAGSAIELNFCHGPGSAPNDCG